MKKQNLAAVLAIVLPFCCVPSGFAQLEKPDEIKTSKGSLLIQPIQHGSIVFTWDSKTVYIDPYGGAKYYQGLKAPDMIVITDIHGDHMNVETLNAIQTSKAVMVVPEAVAVQLPEKFKKQCVVIGNDETVSRFGIDITAIPMYNLPETAESRHPKGRGNGYVLNFGGKNVYISGDTEDIPEMRALKGIDIAFVCMNGPTMDIHQAASAVVDFKPKIVYPFHHRGSDIEAFRQLVADGDGTIEVRLKNWYPKVR